MRVKDHQVDARGLSCPMPLLKAKQAINKMAVGEVLEVLATDAGSQRDFAAFARQSGHRLLLSESKGNEFHYLIEKSA
ncbi:sulfurtransferase TusA family protein [Spongiibacter taiwanensis]|uniref:sulfurtransferase TusA family protein n=1 Tax=Spongiibacter taiwanensis TaxID=1748242 RepID=UPI00203552CA|nr:sulfurtransferase TusA family protein [Spongiibacter taiwanensis]USA44076.1 sulfurtransferase TusA family protein [Spongiibacter taiwanensis]